LFNGESWVTCQQMPLPQFNKILTWRIKYEEEKQKKIEEEMNKNKAEINNKSSSQSKLNKYK